MSAADEPKIVEEAVDAPEVGDDAAAEDGEAPDMAKLQEMMGGMGGMGGMAGGGGEDGGMGGMDMSALMGMLGKGGGKGGMGGMGDMMGGMGGMGDMMGGMGGMGGKGGGKGAPDESEKADAGGKWHWQQKGEEIQVRVPLDPPALKKDISVKFKVASLAVSVRGESIIDGALAGKVEVDDCTWCLTPDKTELQVMLTQVAGREDAWPNLLA